MLGNATQESEPKAQKLYFTEEDASGFRHQLGNVVTVIKSYSSLMLMSAEKGYTPDNNAMHLKTIVESANRVQDAMLKFTLLQQVNSGALKPIADMTPTHFAEVIEQTCAWYAASIERHQLTVSCEVAEDVPTPNGEVYLRYIIQELMHNAIQATNTDGHIHVAVTREADSLLLTVQDDGIGISADEHHQIGERWHGGIGLYLIYRIVEDMFGGRVAFESVEDEGTIFYVEIPL